MLTFGLVKSRATQLGFLTNVQDAVSKCGLKIMLMKSHRMSDLETRMLYAQHIGKFYWLNLYNSAMSGDVVLLILDKQIPDSAGQNTVALWRNTIATLRHDYEFVFLRDKSFRPLNKADNALHGSDTEHAAAHEVRLFFPHYVV